MDQYLTQSPVLFIVYNRFDTAKLTFDEIRKVKPPRIYIAADGPKSINDKEKCEVTRSIINKIDWNCQVFTLLRDINLGCKSAVSSAISWFFESEEMGIILEDDCLPSLDFFIFCDQLLEKYKDDNKISIISGCNFQHGKKWGINSYYFSNLTHIWGWASWKRVWMTYDVDLENYDENFALKSLNQIFHNHVIVEKWIHVFKQLKALKIDTWDYQFTFINFFHNRNSIIPNVNLIRNIGFGESATHTTDSINKNANLPFESLNEITHPSTKEIQVLADYETLCYEFGIKTKNRKVFSKIIKMLLFLKFLKNERS